MKYTRKPEYVDAVQWHGAGFNGPDPVPDWITTALLKRTLYSDTSIRTDRLVAVTPEGEVHVDPTDWIVRRPNGGSLLVVNNRDFTREYESTPQAAKPA